MIIENLFDARGQTLIFSALMILALLLSIRRRDESGFFPVSLTQELKGWAMILIVLSHIGYFLFSNHQFLYPWSIMAGVGVDLFLFLSGFGLVLASQKKDLGVWQFYKKRLLRLFAPLWIVLVILLLMDKFILNISYDWQIVVKSFFGLLQTADIYRDINSPLWYFSLILLYYLTFPFIFQKKSPAMAALLWFLLGYYLTDINWQFFADVNRLHILHIGAFPLGVWLAGWSVAPPIYLKIVFEKLKTSWKSIPSFVWWILRLIGLVVSVYAVIYFAVNSGIGGDRWLVQKISLVTVLAVVAVALLKPIRIKSLEWFGIYSYEIYLIHWPLMYRYDMVYQYLPAGIATFIYIVLLLGLGWVFKKGTDKLLAKI